MTQYSKDILLMEKFQMMRMENRSIKLPKLKKSKSQKQQSLLPQKSIEFLLLLLLSELKKVEFQAVMCDIKIFNFKE
jgi:hypothetical protein